MERGGGIKRRKKVNKLKQQSGKCEIQEEIHQFDIPGVTRIQLSSATQEAIGCIVGEDITPENPWGTIPKQRLLDAILEENSELLQLKEAITSYPADEVMLGYDPSLVNLKEQVFICLTLEAKKEVTDLIKRNKEETHEKIKKSLVKVPRKWNSLGSEAEVDGMITKNFRPLIEVKVKSKFPLHDNSTKFSMRRMEDAPDGYMKLVSTRETFNHITRKQVDAGAQAAPYMVSSEVQTNPPYPQNKWTQYSYKIDKKNRELEMTPEILDTLKKRAETLSEEIRVNEYIDYHSFDYSYRDIPMFRPLSLDIQRIFVFQDVMSCKGKKVSSLAWHPTISGLLLASYVQEHPFAPTYSSDTKKCTHENIHEKKLVLLWCYSDNLQPKLYLESYREVISVSFCDYDPNIIVGGCDNGQVVIWDITGRLEEVETKEMLTESEQLNRKLMYSLVEWMKISTDAAWIQPTVVSAIAHGHSKSITGISWLPQSYHITRNGKVEHQPDKVNLQFMTCGLDGLIHFWDLNSSPITQRQGQQKRHGRLKTRPSALTLNISWLKPLDKGFAPQFRLIVEDKHRFSITRMVSVTPNYIYTPINKETVNVFEERTYYNHEFTDTEVFSQKIYVATSTGKFMEVTWEGNDFDQGQVVNSEKGTIKMFNSTHDGPIRSCQASPHIQNTVLTVGGKLFTVWSIKYFKPIMWHNAEVEYVSGLWSSTNLNIILINRIDGEAELWNLSYSSCKPSIIMHLTSNLLLDLITDNKKYHSRKNTVAMADNTGTIHILHVRNFTECYTLDNIDEIHKRLLICANRRLKTKTWTDQFREKHRLKKEEKPETDEEVPESKDAGEKHVKDKSEPFDTLDKILTQKWESQQEKDMYMTLLDRKRLNVKEISRNSQLVREKRREKRMFQEKQTRKIDDREKAFEKEKESLYVNPMLKTQTNIKLDDVVEKKLLEKKKSYVTDYYQLEEHYKVKLEKRHLHLVNCDWAELMTTVTSRRDTLNHIHSKVNLHPQRYEQEVINEQKKEVERVTLYASRIVNFDDEDNDVSTKESNETELENDQERKSTEE